MKVVLRNICSSINVRKIEIISPDKLLVKIERMIDMPPRSFANMAVSERTRACYQHAIIKYLDGQKMKNSTLCERFGIDKKNAAQASAVIKKALKRGYIKPADPECPRSGYEPIWA